MQSTLRIIAIAVFVFAVMLGASACGDDTQTVSQSDVLGDTSSDAPTPCIIDCDCPQGQVCASGTCAEVREPIYCCDKASCPMGARCVSTGGAVDVCAECVVDCDCPQGQGCASGACRVLDAVVLCCSKPGCNPGQPCTDLEGDSSTCARECQVDCDCPQGRFCSAAGLCLEGLQPTYCCDNPGCPIGDACTGRDGAASTCRECDVDCDCPQGQLCSAAGICTAGTVATYCCDNPGCPQGVVCAERDGTASTCRECDLDCDCPQGQACSAAGLCVEGVTPSYCCDNPGCPTGNACVKRSGTAGSCAAQVGCGNGIIDPGETCDGNCPTACSASSSCVTATLQGSPATCSSHCVVTPIGACVHGDSCCPAGCDYTVDHDCPQSCGNGTVDVGETCDGNCPTSCTSSDACTAGTLVGNAAGCTAECVFSPITRCSLATDGCCPAGCTDASDPDCQAGTGHIGAPCADATDCVDGSCFVDVRDGACTKPCTGNADCPAGSHCAGQSCYPDCSSTTDCRGSGWGCYNFDGDAANSKECAPLGIGTSPVGGACDSIQDCAGGERVFCALARDGFKNGYCVRDCSSGCPSGSHCSTALGSEYCVDTCTSASNCRGSGYTCENRDGSGALECVPTANGGGGVGAPCTGLWDCAGDGLGLCLTEDEGYPGGYCTLTGCDYFSMTGCPAGTHCGLGGGAFPIGGAAYCAVNCSATSTCRAGYTCHDVLLELLAQGTTECWP